ncbi:MAG TPA: hypothetical protein VNK95_14655, partial [Caldilineaceae bacterium]|nr:hypothetical protein [Caldilineaceae bacterium]
MELTCCRLQIALPAGAPAQRQHWQRRATLALAGVELAPRGLPPQAILVVRRLADPAPGVLLQGTPWQAGRQWGAAARTQLEACWRQAARPIRGPVPPAAPAVWFADQAEWLACLSLDLAFGVAHARWWWLAWRSRLDNLGALWRAEARWLPAALALLAGADPLPTSAGPVPTPGVFTPDLPRLLAHLEPVALPAIAAALTSAFALPPLALDSIESEQLRLLIPQEAAARVGLLEPAEKWTPVQRLLAAALALAAQPTAVAQALRRPRFFVPPPASQPIHAARPQEPAPPPAIFNPPPTATTARTTSGEPPASRPPAPPVQANAAKRPRPPRRA